MDVQLKKGLLDVCVLATLVKGDSYGWQVIKDLVDVIDISESTLYPILKRLEQSGGISTYEVPHNGRLRKYIKLTDIGRQRLEQFKQDSQGLRQIYDFIENTLKEGDNE
ncbi:MAG: PadR family transcriptional regulator [Firmicutes bacterium]|nr:PadR family transcriptional regulator [Bacillota bacterium]